MRDRLSIWLLFYYCEDIMMVIITDYSALTTKSKVRQLCFEVYICYAVVVVFHYKEIVAFAVESPSRLTLMTFKPKRHFYFIESYI